MSCHLLNLIGVANIPAVPMKMCRVTPDVFFFPLPHFRRARAELHIWKIRMACETNTRFGVWCLWWFYYPGLLLHTELTVSLFIRCTTCMRCEILAQPELSGRLLESHPRQLIFLRKSDCLGVLCCSCLFV